MYIYNHFSMQITLNVSTIQFQNILCNSAGNLKQTGFGLIFSSRVVQKVQFVKLVTKKEEFLLNFFVAGEREEPKRKILSVKCKVCMLEGEINSMSTLKKTWVDGYSGGRLVSLKDHCNGKPHLKVLCSFKVSLLKMLGEVGQKEG